MVLTGLLYSYLNYYWKEVAMKRNITIIAASIIIATIFAKLGVFDALLLFIIIGAVPGTTFTVPSFVLLLAYSTIAIYIVAKLAARHALYTRLITRLKARYEAYRGRLPKRRYSEI
jgi:hypothetical protein